MKEIIKIFENSMSLTITTIIAAIGVGLNVWFNKKAMGDPQREELIKSKFEIYKDMYLQIVLIKRSHCLNKSASEIDEIIKNYYKNLIENERDKLVLLDGRTIICSKIYLMKNIQIILIQNVQAIQKPIVKKGGNNLCDHIKSISWNLI